jgi:hypothetical protein
MARSAGRPTAGVLAQGDAMAIDASGVLGSRQLAGVKVNPPGYAWRLARNQTGNMAADFVLGGQPRSGPIWAVIAVGLEPAASPS